MAYDWSQSPQPVMGSGDGMSTVAGAASQFIGMAIDDARQSYWNEKQQQQYRENMQQQFDLGQQAQRNAARNQVAGLEAAGLSPVMGHSAAGAPVGSSQMPTLPSLQRFSPLEVVQMRNLEAQKRNLDAQTVKTEADAESVKIDNLNKKQRDTAYTVIMDNELDHLRQLYAGDEKAQELIDMYKALPKSEGTYNAYERTLSMLPKTFGSRADMLAEHLREKVNMARDSSSDPKFKDGVAWIDNPFLKSLVTADTAETDRTIADIAKLYADTDNIKETLGLIQKQKDLTSQDIERVKALANQIRNSDVKTMIEKGDYAGALFALLSGLIMGLGNYK